MLNFVFVHGGGQGSWVWRDVIAAIGSNGQAIALDVPGCGVKRNRDSRSLTHLAVVDELFADIDASGLSNITLVGHSMAGTLLPLLLRKRPGIYRCAIYVSCCAPAPGQTVRDMIGDGLHGGDPEKVGWPVARQTTPYRDFASAMFCNDMDERQTQDFLNQLGQDSWPDDCRAGYRDWYYGDRPQLPTSYVILDRDQSLPPDWQLRFAARLGAERIMHLDAGHQVMQTRPAALAQILMMEAAWPPGRHRPIQEFSPQIS